jgi:Calcineurin-like phosphoesterase
MLIIGDIHINAKHARALIYEISAYIEAQSDETNIVFVGDYMYMFSYDRQALGDLFDLFLSLWKQGKSLYILTGNHDRVGQHFLYHEGKKIADLLNRGTHTNVIQFITEPTRFTIEWRSTLFLPYNKSFLAWYLDHARTYISQQQPSLPETIATPIDILNFDTQRTADIPPLSPRATIIQETAALLESAHPQELLSGALNAYVLEHLAPEETLIHHYYIADVKMPGQDAIYRYKDLALHALRAQVAPRVISGHIHKAFVYHNYLCVGSLRYTTSGERDHAKRLWQWDTASDRFTPTEISINPYLTWADAASLTASGVHARLAQIREEDVATWSLGTSTIAIQTPHTISHDLKTVTPILFTTESVQTIDTLIETETKQAFADIQLKHRASSHEDMSKLLTTSQYKLQESLMDWKELVKNYILSIYWDQSDKYRTVLSELDIL